MAKLFYEQTWPPRPEEGKNNGDKLVQTGGVSGLSLQLQQRFLVCVNELSAELCWWVSTYSDGWFLAQISTAKTFPSLSGSLLILRYNKVMTKHFFLLYIYVINIIITCWFKMLTFYSLYHRCLMNQKWKKVHMLFISLYFLFWIKHQPIWQVVMFWLWYKGNLEAPFHLPKLILHRKPPSPLMSVEDTDGVIRVKYCSWIHG